MSDGRQHRPRVLALYLPQFHPDPANDEFWGPGYTEWRSVAMARPRFADHRQPRIPADLGFYDLRVRDTAVQQEQLATSAGIEAFVYFHYWFEGRRVLGLPLDNKLADAERAMPFALCWANHDWNRIQNGAADELLIAQTYSAHDDEEHAAFLATVFADPRYLRVGDRPVFFVYRTQHHPDPHRFAHALADACAGAGVAQPYLIRFETNGTDDVAPHTHGCDAAAELHPHWLYHTPADQRPAALALGHPHDWWCDYDEVAAFTVARPPVTWLRAPCVVPDWDTTARRPLGGAFALRGSTPQGYEAWLRRALALQPTAPADERFVVINAWNEWSECGYLEPDIENGHAYLTATARATGKQPAAAAAPPAPVPAASDTAKMYRFEIDADDPAQSYHHVLALVGPDRRVLEVGSGGGHMTKALADRGNRVTAIDLNPDAVAHAATFAEHALALDLDAQLPSDALAGQTFDIVVLADVLEHLRAPQRVLTDVVGLLAEGGAAVISVPNVAHADVRLMLLQGRWAYQATGLLDDSHLRWFTAASLRELLRSAGLVATELRRTERAPLATSVAFDRATVPAALVDALRADPAASTYQYIVRAQPIRAGLHDALDLAPVVPDLASVAPDELAELRAARDELAALQRTKLMRVAAPLRALYARVRRLR